MHNSQFEEEWESLKRNHGHGSFHYADPSTPVKEAITSHFRGPQRSKKYGVYLIRQKSTLEVLYIGKGGTIRRDGTFRDQDIPGRLKNKHGKVSAEVWFGNLLREKGPLIVEYVFLASKPQSPAFVEALLLQSYLNEYGRLPDGNTAF